MHVYTSTDKHAVTVAQQLSVYTRVTAKASGDHTQPPDKNMQSWPKTPSCTFEPA